MFAPKALNGFGARIGTSRQRSDFFTTLKHPNFGSPINAMTSPKFGQSTQMLNNYLGFGGQNGGLNRCTKSAGRARFSWR